MKENGALMSCCPFIPCSLLGHAGLNVGTQHSSHTLNPAKAKSRTEVPGRGTPGTKVAEVSHGSRIELTTASKNRKAEGQSPGLLPGLGCLLSFFLGLPLQGCGTELLGTLNQKAAVKNRAVRAAGLNKRAISVKAVNTELML